MWSDVLTWRNAIYNVVINAFKHMGDIARTSISWATRTKPGVILPAFLGSRLKEASPCIVACPCLPAEWAYNSWATRTVSGV